MSKEELIIRIKSDASITVDEVYDDTVKTKNIIPETLIECIKGSIKQETIFSGLLPENCIAYSFNPQSGDCYVVIRHNETRADIKYMNTTYQNLPLPRLLFGFELDYKWKVRGVTVGVPFDEKLTEDTPMYAYPFSNVSRFSMCTGSNTLPTIKALQSLSNLPYYILSLPNNDDNFSDKDNAIGLCHRELLEHLRGKDTAYYYEKILVPMRGTTLKQFLN